MTSIEQLKEIFDAAESAYTSHQDAAPGREASNADYFAHVGETQRLYALYKAAADAYIAAVHEQRVAARRVPTVGSVADLPRYHGTLEWKEGGYGYITPDKHHGLISQFRVEARHILGVTLTQRQTVTVEFSIALSFRNALLVVIDGNEAARAAFAAYLETRRVRPSERKTLYQQQLDQDRALAKEYARKGDYMDRFYEADLQEDSSYQQAQDIRSLLG